MCYFEYEKRAIIYSKEKNKDNLTPEEKIGYFELQLAYQEQGM